MANQIDNLVVNDNTLGLNRTIDVSSDDLFISVDLTLQSGGVLTADNIKRGTADPNVAFVAGNEGDLYQRTLGATGQLWYNGDGTTTGWVQVTAGGGDTWALVLAAGNTSGGTNPEISAGDSIVGEDNGAGDGGDVPITAGSATAANDDGGDIILSPGSGFGTGDPGIVQVNGPKHYANSATDPTNPAPATGDRYYNTAMEMEFRYDGTRSKWLSTSEATFQLGRNNNLSPAPIYLRAINAMVTSATLGYDAFWNGTVVGVSIVRSTASGAVYAVTASGTDISTISYVVGSNVRDNTADGDFSQGDTLAARLVTDALAPESNVQMWVRVKWRAT